MIWSQNCVILCILDSKENRAAQLQFFVALLILNSSSTHRQHLTHLKVDSYNQTVTINSILPPSFPCNQAFLGQTEKKHLWFTET